MLYKFLLLIAVLLHFTFLACDDSSERSRLAYRRGIATEPQPQPQQPLRVPKKPVPIVDEETFNKFFDKIAAPGFIASDADIENFASLYQGAKQNGASKEVAEKRLAKMVDLKLEGEPFLAKLAELAKKAGAGQKYIPELFSAVLVHALETSAAVVDDIVGQQTEFDSLAIYLDTAKADSATLASLAPKVAAKFPQATGKWLGENRQRPAFKKVYASSMHKKEDLRNGLFSGLVISGKSFTNAFTLIRDYREEWGLEANLDDLLFSVTNNEGLTKANKFAVLENEAVDSYQKKIKALAAEARNKVAAQIVEIRKSPAMSTVIGMKNCGNSCYLNSVLQPILHTRQINKLLNTELDLLDLAEKDLFGDKITRDNRLFLFLRKVFQKNKSAALNTFISPGPFVKKKSELMPLIEGSQEDASEFLTFFLDRLRTEFNVIKDKREFYEASLELKSRSSFAINFQESAQYSVFDFWFTGYLRVDRETTDGKKTKNFDPFQMLALPMPKDIGKTDSVSLEKMIEDYSAKETLEPSEGGGTKQISFHTLPKVLIVQAKRYKTQAGGAFRADKLDNPIDFKSTLEINSDKDGQVEYELYATSNHGGGTGGGHYWSYVKNSEGKWFNANDSSISPVDIAGVRKDNQSAYIFYYRRK